MTPDDARGSPDPGRHPFVERPNRTLLTLSVPVLLSLVAEPLTGLVDTAFVARLGAAPLAGLGVGAALLSSALWVFNFLGIGTQTEVAHALGAGDRARARDTSGLALALAALIGAGMAALFWPALPVLARAMGASGAVHDAARVYLEIRLLGGPPMLGMLAAFGALRGMHDMRTPLRIAVAINALNVVLDALLIFGFGPGPALGIAGAAWATVISQWVGGAWALAALRRRLGLPSRIVWRDARALLVVGRDLFLRTGLLVAFVLLATRAANRVGAEAGAAHQAIRQVWMLTALALDAYAATAQSLVGYFLGARRRELARRAALLANAWGIATGAALCAGMLLCEGAVARALVPEDARQVFSLAWRLAALAQPLNAVSFVTDGIHWGTRDYRYLRNAMLSATALGSAGLLAVDAAGSSSLAAVWLVTGGWIAVRAAFGWLRLQPGVGAAPLAPGTDPAS
ncbi:MAG TPA: MATE family efflux transporter [Myxococcota bacterium]